MPENSAAPAARALPGAAEREGRRAAWPGTKGRRVPSAFSAGTLLNAARVVRSGRTPGMPGRGRGGRMGLAVGSFVTVPRGRGAPHGRII